MLTKNNNNKMRKMLLKMFIWFSIVQRERMKRNIHRVERKTKKDSIIGMREAISGMWDLD